MSTHRTHLRIVDVLQLIDWLAEKVDDGHSALSTSTYLHQEDSYLTHLCISIRAAQFDTMQFAW